MLPVRLKNAASKEGTAHRPEQRVEQVGRGVPASVDGAVRAVPREAFLPGTPLAEAYGDSPVVTHRDKDGVATSSASAPGIVAAMLAQLDVRQGQRILEIGAGTGYNAALLAHLTGPAGRVTTIELDPGVAAEAKERCLCESLFIARSGAATP